MEYERKRLRERFMPVEYERERFVHAQYESQLFDLQQDKLRRRSKGKSEIKRKKRRLESV